LKEMVHWGAVISIEAVEREAIEKSVWSAGGQLNLNALNMESSCASQRRAAG
jgi:hypothetical protein